MDNKNCLFIINGLGMGNSTRCYAIIEHLLGSGMKVHVLTSGNGMLFFKDKSSLSSLSSMDSLFYCGTEKGVSVWKTILYLPVLIHLFIKKCFQVSWVVKKIKPDVVVIDSEYAIFPLLKRKFPLISINNSDFIVSEYLKRKNKPRSISLHFWIIEFSDYIFNCFFPDIVISPSLYAAKINHPKFKHVGIIVRNELIKKAGENIPAETRKPLPKEVASISCILSSSVFGKETKLEFGTLPYKINIIGREGKNYNNLIYHGFLVDNTEELTHADFLIINSGASSTNEAVFLNKPTLVIPIEGHAEQYINACILRDYGIGLICKPQEIRSILEMFYAKNSWGNLKIPRRTVTADGAKEAAEIILSFRKI